MTDTTTYRSSWVIVGRLFTLIGFIGLMVMIACSYLYLSQENLHLAQQMAQLEQQTKVQNTTLATMQNTVLEMEQKQTKWQTDWETAQKGDFSIWRVKEAQYIAHLAKDQGQFSPDVPHTIQLLERADELLQPVTNAEIMPVRAALTATLTQLRGMPIVDTSALYAKLIAVNQQLDQLPLLSQPLEPTTTTTDTTGLPWWKAGLLHTWDTLKKVVIVRHQNTAILPVVMPDEKQFLYQNLHAQMEGVLWSVMHQQSITYNDNLSRLILWVHTYFDQNAAVTKNVLASLQDAQKITMQSPTIDLTTLLTSFDQYFSAMQAKSGSIEQTEQPKVGEAI